MDLKQQLDKDLKSAMKCKDKTKVSVLRMVLASVKRLEIDNKKTLTDDETMEVLLKEIKQRRDSISEFGKAGRDDLVQKETQEITILEEYLPKQLTDEELRSLVLKEIEVLEATDASQMGRVMAAIMPKIKGLADGKKAQQIVREILK